MTAMQMLLQGGVDELLYGGAAGGGKSELARALAYALAIQWPHARIPIFRLTFPELQETHLDTWLMKMDELGWDNASCWEATPKQYRFVQHRDPEITPPMSMVEFRHIDQSLGAIKWQSAEWAAVIVDEGVTFQPRDLQILISRVRRPQEGPAKEWVDWHPIVLIASNPGDSQRGGPAHRFLKETYVDQAEAHSGLPWDAEEEWQGITYTRRRAFLPSKLDDNPSISKSEYVFQLASMSEGDRARLLDGDWSYFEGRVFYLADDTHDVRASAAFAGEEYPPVDWPRAIGFDQGNANPAAAEWIVREHEGFFVVYQEYYSPGPDTQHIEQIWEGMQRDGVICPDVTVLGDPAMQRTQRGQGKILYSLATEYRSGGMYDDGFHEQQGLSIFLANTSRELGRSVTMRMLEPSMNRYFPSWHPRSGEPGAPQLFIDKQRCPNLWRELNGITWKPGTQEDTLKQDDHAYDALWHALPAFERSLAAKRSHQPQMILQAVHN